MKMNKYGPFEVFRMLQRSMLIQVKSVTAKRECFIQSMKEHVSFIAKVAILHIAEGECSFKLC